MKIKKIIPAFCFFSLLVIAGKAQLTKPFSIVDVADNYVATLQGDTHSQLIMKWTSADLKVPGSTLRYSIQLDTIGGDFNNPWVIIGSACCANFFTDTTVAISFDFLAKEIKNALYNRYKKSFVQGESITLDWIVMANATGSNATYDNRATASRRITFVRGQFDQEYVPVKLSAPLDNSSFTVQDNPSVNLKFQWTKAYCPTGCGTAQYQIMFDSMGGDFSQPLYFYTVPQSPFDTILDLRQDVLAQMMYDDGVAINTPKTYKWAVSALGNNGEIVSDVRRISLLRGLMRFEHVPFTTLLPVDNAVFKLEINKTDSVEFKWRKTRSGFPDGASYTVLFDTAKATPDFSKPIFRFKTAVGDTAYKARYIELRDSLDKKYGIHWKTVSLRWTVEADIIGYKFMSEDTNDLLIARGYFTGMQPLATTAGLLVYPNPATTYIYIETQAGIGGITITDIAGRQVACYEAGTAQADISNLAAGVYFVTTTDKNGLPVQPYRFIKQ